MPRVEFDTVEFVRAFLNPRNRAGNASYLVSEDRDLLDLVEYEGIRIVDTASFLNMLPS